MSGVLVEVAVAGKRVHLVGQLFGLVLVCKSLHLFLGAVVCIENICGLVHLPWPVSLQLHPVKNRGNCQSAKDASCDKVLGAATKSACH